MPSMSYEKFDQETPKKASWVDRYCYVNAELALPCLSMYMALMHGAFLWHRLGRGMETMDMLINQVQSHRFTMAYGVLAIAVYSLATIGYVMRQPLLIDLQGRFSLIEAAHCVFRGYVVTRWLYSDLGFSETARYPWLFVHAPEDAVNLHGTPNTWIVVLGWLIILNLVFCYVYVYMKTMAFSRDLREDPKVVVMEGQWGSRTDSMDKTLMAKKFLIEFEAFPNKPDSVHIMNSKV